MLKNEKLVCDLWNLSNIGPWYTMGKVTISVLGFGKITKMVPMAKIIQPDPIFIQKKKPKPNPNKHPIQSSPPHPLV